MVALTICCDFEAQENKILHCFHFPPSICHEMMEPDAMILVFECWVLSQLFHFPLSHSSRGSLVLLHFLPLNWYHLHICGCWYFSRQSWFQLVSHPAQHFLWCTLHVSWWSRMTIHSLDLLLFQFWTGQFSFQSLRKAMPKNAPTTTQLHSSHMLVK